MTPDLAALVRWLDDCLGAARRADPPGLWPTDLVFREELQLRFRMSTLVPILSFDNQ